MSVPSWAVRGAKVVCISAGWTPGHIPEPGFTHPQVGEVLTIAEVSPRYGWITTLWGLAFVEKHALDIYLVDNFAPVVNDDTEAAIYRAKGLRTSAPKRVSETA